MCKSTELKYNEPWILQRADPYVYRHTDGFYYFTASIPAYDQIALRRSETLAGLADAEEVVIWRKHESGIMSEHIWAPELHYLDGKWYVYFAGGEKEDVWAICPYVLECADASRNIYGPGHNCFTVDEEGNPVMVYHARIEEKIVGNPLYNPNRHAMIMKLKFEEETGRPVFSYE